MFQDPNKINAERNSLPFSNFLNEVDAGRVVEVKIQGNNISGILADGKTFKKFGSAQDHKRVGEGDEGLNTGGMGAYSPSRLESDILNEKILYAL